ncbi:MAG: NADH-quinone oxidoreductase subunit L, partial [Candidatus Rokubacteria bacterium]|nr:NADH-quinone oxidoreductase subunit L [Candidatus Rokubacteria bacterium]
GILTALFAASIGLVQNDIKRILAYSTISQLGYMFAGVGVGAYAAGIYHLVTHAFFKALLFLAAGSVIHALGGEQDIRRMGGLARRLPVTTLTFLVAAVAIAGIPPFAGFFSKDEILAAAWASGHLGVYALGLLGAAFTAFYIFRLVFLAFFGPSRLDAEAARHLHESPSVMTIPLGFLAVLSAVGGVWGLPGEHGTPIARFLDPVLPLGEAALEPGTGPLLMAVAVATALGGILAAWRMYLRRPVPAERLGVPSNRLHVLLLGKYYVDELYDALFVRPLVAVSEWCARVFDLGVIDGLVNGAADLVGRWSAVLRRVQTGLVMNYALSMLVGAVILLGLLVRWR